MGKDKIEDARRKSSRRVSGNRGVADYASLSPQVLANAITAVASQGGALRLGYTSDGGAYAVGIYGDGDPYTDYVKPGDDAEAYFLDVTAAWER